MAASWQEDDCYFGIDENTLKLDRCEDFVIIPNSNELNGKIHEPCYMNVIFF